MGISIRAYARHRGVSDAAVHKAIRTGRITPEGDGTIDPARAAADWARNTEATRPGTRQSAVTVRMPDAGEEPSPLLPATGTSLLQARTVNEVVKAQTNKVRLARVKGELVDRAQAITHVFRLARTERDAWLNWLARISAPLAAKRGVDPHELHIALEAAVRGHLQEVVNKSRLATWERRDAAGHDEATRGGLVRNGGARTSGFPALKHRVILFPSLMSPLRFRRAHLSQARIARAPRRGCA